VNARLRLQRVPAGERQHEHHDACQPQHQRAGALAEQESDGDTEHRNNHHPGRAGRDQRTVRPVAVQVQHGGSESGQRHRYGGERQPQRRAGDPRRIAYERAAQPDWLASPARLVGDRRRLGHGPGVQWL
jgi:hypothetical protein